MSEIIDLILSLSQKTIDIKSRIVLLRLSRAWRLKDSCNENQEVLQTLHKCRRTLLTFRKIGGLAYSKIRGKFYYKVTEVEEFLQSNHYKPNFKCYGVK